MLVIIMRVIVNLRLRNCENAEDYACNIRAKPTAGNGSYLCQTHAIAHNISLKDIERRFARSLKNLFTDFSQQADHTRCFMNDGLTPIPVFEQQANGQRDVLHDDYYQQLLKAAGL